MNVTRLEKVFRGTKNKEHDSDFSMKKSRRKTHKKDSFKDIEEKIREEESDPRAKTITEFDQFLACSVKSLAVRKTNNVTPTTLFFSGKMLMFIKISLISFIYDMLKTFCFPSEKSKYIFEKYMIEQIFLYIS